MVAKGYKVDNSEIAWRDDQLRHGWVMPRALWWKRLPVVRHVRGAVASFHVHRYATAFASVGIGIGGPNQFDLWICYGIRTGKERPMRDQ